MAGNKYIANSSGTYTETAALQSSAGAGDAGKIIALDSAGKIDTTMMPTGVTADTLTMTASETLAAGDFINIHNSSGAKVRKADASTTGKEAHGFVLAGISSAASGTVYFEGSNTQVTGQTPGPVFLSATAGLATSTAPSTAGQTVQRIGFATSSTSINFQSQSPLTLA